MIISTVFFTDLSRLPVGGKMISLVGVTEIVYRNISSKRTTCIYVCVYTVLEQATSKKFYPATYAYSTLGKMKRENNIIFIFMKPCVRTVD